MRRGTLIVALLAVAAGAAFLLLKGDGDGSMYRVAAVFDSARRVEPGMNVKIAGVRVGEVRSVHLTGDLKARIEFEVPGRFAPFRSDANCHIRPEGLISENFVQCDPGTRGEPALEPEAGGAPTVPVDRTTVPVTLQDVIDIFGLPVNQQLRVLINELGLATAGRGDDLNAILRRANPALSEVRRVMSLVNRQKHEISEAVAQTDRVMATLADQRREVRGFVREAAGTTRTMASHRNALGETVRRLPDLLTRLRTSSLALREIARNGTPLLRSLQRAAPELTTLMTDLPRFLRPARPALRALGSLAAQGRVTSRSARPVLSHLRTFADRGRSPSENLDLLLSSMRQQGAVDGLLDFGYLLSTFVADYDATSHLASFLVFPTPCLADPDASGCDGRYNAPRDDSQGRSDTGGRSRRPDTPAREPTRSADTGDARASEERSEPQRERRDGAPHPSSPSEPAMTNLLDFLLK